MAGQLGNRWQVGLLACGVAAVSLVALGSATARVGPVADEGTTRADVIIAGPAAATPRLQRPKVPFAHDLHTEALAKEGKSCQECHPADATGRNSTAFARLPAQMLAPDATRSLYHDRCIGCHEQSGGPLTCGGCHQMSQRWKDARVPMGFDRSLHAVHVAAEKSECKSCHHVRDEKSGALVWARGQEASCQDCHPRATEQGKTSLRLAVHAQCVGCHTARRAAQGAQAKVGPVECAGCHGENAQARFPHLAEVPRLDRGQPDLRFLAPPKDETALATMRSVPFDHRAIEAATPTCRSCHHRKLEACRACHRLRGVKEGGRVTLSTAMHAPDSPMSCIGCHDRIMREDPSCTGCHAMVASRHTAEAECARCHAGPMAGSEAMAVVRPEQVLESMRSDLRVTFEPRSVPEKKKLGTLAAEYVPADFPHARMIGTLQSSIARSRVAAHFHGGGETTCLACHHESRRRELPVACSSCHLKDARPGRAGLAQVPSLKAAYHMQCIGCHARMTKGPTDCTGCHAKR